MAACGELHSTTMKSLKMGLKYSQSTYRTGLGLLLAAQFGHLVHFVSSCLMTTLVLLHRAVVTSNRDLVKLHIIEVVSSKALTDPEPLTLCGEGKSYKFAIPVQCSIILFDLPSIVKLIVNRQPIGIGSFQTKQCVKCEFSSTFISLICITNGIMECGRKMTENP